MTNSLASLAIPLAETNAFTGLLLSIIRIAQLLLLVYVLIDLARNFMRDVPGPVVQVHTALAAVWEPVLRPIRNALPAMGGIDFSPLIILLGLSFIGAAIA